MFDNFITNSLQQMEIMSKNKIISLLEKKNLISL